MDWEILFEDNHLLVVHKPAGLLVQGDATGDPNLLDLAKARRKELEKKPGNVYLGLVHRLDRPVSGVVVLARTSKSAARLSEQFRTGAVDKRYLAVLDVAPDRPADPAGSASEGLWSDWLRKDEASNVVSVTTGSAEGARQATTNWRLLARVPQLWLVELLPRTGRAHQLRVQAAARKLPIYGDLKYGSRHTFDGAIALHAWSLTIEHPTLHERMTFTAPPPSTWSQFPFDVKNCQPSAFSG